MKKNIEEYTPEELRYFASFSSEDFLRFARCKAAKNDGGQKPSKRGVIKTDIFSVYDFCHYIGDEGADEEELYILRSDLDSLSSNKPTYAKGTILWFFDGGDLARGWYYEENGRYNYFCEAFEEKLFLEQIEEIK